MKPEIIPFPKAGRYREHSLSGLTAEAVEALLGFPPNVEDDPDKVSHSWGFAVNGEHCGVWSYRGSEKLGVWSAFGPAEQLRAIFKNHLVT